MRKSYYRVARDSRFGLCTLCLPIDVSLAIARDAQRPERERVGSATIGLMADTLQWPELTRHPWEQAMIRLEPAEEPPLGLAVGDEKHHLWAQLAAAIARPVQAEAVGGAEQLAREAAAAESAAQSAASTVHQFDLRLRKVIAEHMKSVPGPARGAVGKLLSERKKHALQACRKCAQAAAPAESAQAAADAEEEIDAALDALEHEFTLLLRLEAMRLSPSGPV